VKNKTFITETDRHKETAAFYLELYTFVSCGLKYLPVYFYQLPFVLTSILWVIIELILNHVLILLNLLSVLKTHTHTHTHQAQPQTPLENMWNAVSPAALLTSCFSCHTPHYERDARQLVCIRVCFSKGWTNLTQKFHIINFPYAFKIAAIFCYCHLKNCEKKGLGRSLSYNELA
jgi:hypothetical protein